MLYLDSTRLSVLMHEALAQRGVAPGSAQHVVDSLVQSSLRGVDSHGITLFPHYCRAVVAGRINPAPELELRRSAAATASLDARHGFGHHAGAFAMDRAIEIAKESGMGSVSVAHSTHFGAAAYFALRAAERDCLGFAFTNADALVKAFGSSQSFFGTNPICFTAPMRDEGPFCLDMATSLVSWNKIANYRRLKQQIPADVAYDAEGAPVTDPDQAVSLSPIGNYKGFGLGMMVEILCALLAGGPIGRDIMKMYTEPLDDSKRDLSHFFLAVDIGRFVDPALFKEQLQVTADRIRALPALDPDAAVMVAGDPEKSCAVRRSASGIPMDQVKFEEFLAVSPSFAEALLP